MKLVCSKSNLLNGVQIVSRAVPNKTTMSILECILIDASGSIITLTANDMDLGIETVIEGDILEKGIIALDAKIFLEIVRKLPDSLIRIESDSSFRTVITCEKAKFTIAGKSGEDFSYLPAVEKEDSIVIRQFSLKEMVRQTIFSISDNDSNKLMTGELFEINGDEMRLVSSDGHRISIRRLQLRESYAPRKVVVPGKTLNEVSKILSGGSDSDLVIYLTAKHMVFEFDNTVVVSRLIEGEYFSIDRMLSGDYETKVRINKRELLEWIFNNTNNWLHFAEAKNAAMIAFNVAMAAFLAEMDMPRVVFAGLVVSMAVSVWAFYPVNDKLPRISGRIVTANLLHYAYIASLERDQYLQKLYGRYWGETQVNSGSFPQIEKDYCEEIVSNARITLRKQNCFNISFFIDIITMLLLVILFIFT